MSSIVTFYSFKGGVGRTMALANIAVLLARRGLRVLAVDWDLEAPGLHHFFALYGVDPSKSLGLLDLLVDASKQSSTVNASKESFPPDWHSYVIRVGVDGTHPLALLT